MKNSFFADSVVQASSAMESLDYVLADQTREVALTKIAQTIGVERDFLDGFMESINHLMI